MSVEEAGLFRVSIGLENLENLENLKMSVNLKVDPKKSGEVGNLEKKNSVGQPENFLKILNCRPNVLHCVVFLTTKNARILAELW